MRRRTAASVVAGLALALTGVSLPATAHAQGPVANGSDYQVVTLDGTNQVLQLQDELFGRITVSPGSRHERAVTVRNAGPSAATLEVAVVNTRALPEVDRGADTFFEDLRVNDIPASQLEGNRTVVQTTELAEGGKTKVEFDVNFPREATSGNAAEVGEREFSFDVRLSLTGDTDDNACEESDERAKPGTGTGTTTGPVAQTGGVLDTADPWLLAAAALLAALAAVAGRPLLAARRRRAVEHGQ